MGINHSALIVITDNSRTVHTKYISDVVGQGKRPKDPGRRKEGIQRPVSTSRRLLTAVGRVPGMVSTQVCRNDRPWRVAHRTRGTEGRLHPRSLRSRNRWREALRPRGKRVLRPGPRLKGRGEGILDEDGTGQRTRRTMAGDDCLRRHGWRLRWRRRSGYAPTSAHN